MPVIASPMNVRKIIRTLADFGPIADTSANRRHFLLTRRWIDRTIGLVSGSPMNCGYVDNHEFGRHICLSYCDISGPGYLDIVAVYVVDYERKLAKRVIVRASDDFSHDHLLNSIQTHIERWAAQGARACVSAEVAG